MLSMAFVGWTGGRVDAILMSMPSLVYVLGLSGAIHVINYYRDEVRARGHSGAAGRALRHAAVPCSLAALTTAIGLISLYSSNLAPISKFGFYASIGGDRHACHPVFRICRRHYKRSSRSQKRQQRMMVQKVQTRQ